MAQILLVEDDPFIGLDLAAELGRAGFTVTGVATTVASALELFKSRGCDVAVLDVNVGRETSAPVAAALAEEGIPFIAVTGYSAGQCPAEFAHRTLLPKPLQTGRLVAELKRHLPPG